MTGEMPVKKARLFRKDTLLKAIALAMFAGCGLLPELVTCAAAHDMYTQLKDSAGRDCCTGTDCRPASYRISAAGTQMLIDGSWIWVPQGRIQYRALTGDSGETNGGHWCGEPYDGGHITYCAFLPPQHALMEQNQTPRSVRRAEVHTPQ
jgi:hypothetical protein